MENIIKNFLKVTIDDNSGYCTGTGYGSGDGTGCGSGDGCGSGSGNGDGYGSGSGDGCGSGSGNGDGYGSGSGDGCGSGSGNGDGYGSGYGSGDVDGYGYGIKSINNKEIIKIDDVNTVITRVKGNVSKGKILNSDLTLTTSFIVKGNNMFAHGSSLKEAMYSLEEKIFDNIDLDEKIAEFRKVFNAKDKYLASEFYKWHHNLTGSCKMGRDNFVKNNNINLKSKITVVDFIKLTENNYMGDIIKQLKEFYK